MRLKYLSLNKLVDVAYLCGIDGTPISLMLAMPPGSGKTWSTRSIAGSDFVLYLNKVYSPNEHRSVIGRNAARTKLLINDDLGFSARWNKIEYFSTFCMVIDGEIMFTVYKQTQHAVTNFSVVLCCTLDYFYAARNDMVTLGLYDRVVPICLRLSADTRHKYQQMVNDGTVCSNTPAPREPEITDKQEVKKGILEEKDIDPRLLMNLKFMSQYLTDDEFIELINVAHSNGKYEL